MASGRLGALKPAATTYKTLYKPTSAIAHCSLLFCNQTDTSDTMRVAIVQSGSTDPTPSSAEFIAYGADVKAGGNISFVCVGKESV